MKNPYFTISSFFILLSFFSSPASGEVVQVRTGSLNNFAIDSDGKLWAWGDNYGGQFGIGTTNPQISPLVQVPHFDNGTDMQAGLGHSLVLDQSGAVWAAGWNRNGQLGDGTTTDHYTAIQVSGLSNITSIAAGGEYLSRPG